MPDVAVPILDGHVVQRRCHGAVGGGIAALAPFAMQGLHHLSTLGVQFFKTGIRNGYCQANTYIQGFRQFGYGDILDQVHQRWQAGDRVGAEAAIPDYIVEELYIFGTTEECHDQLSRFVDAGVTLPIVASPPTSRLVTDDLHALLKAFGQV